MPSWKSIVAGLAAVVVAFAGITLLALEGREVVVLHTRTAAGDWRTTRVWVADDQGTPLIEVAEPERAFYQDLLEHPEVRLERSGVLHPYRVEVLPQPDGHRLIRAKLREKYGWADVWIGLLADTTHSLAIRLTSVDTLGAPTRVVSLAPSLTEVVFALGLGDRLVGVSSQCDYPEEAKRLPKMGSFVAPTVEAIVAARPDLVLAVPSPGNRNPVEALRALGIDVLVVDPVTLDDIRSMMITLAARLGRAEAGEELAAALDRRIDEVRRRVGDRAPRSVLLAVGRAPLIVAGSGTVQDELLRLAGGVNVVAAAGKGWPRLSLEAALAAAPEVIIDATMGSEADQDAGVAFWQGFPMLPAVRAGRVYAYAENELLRPGPRLGVALSELARRVHPEAYAEVTDRP